ncbi:MAG: protein sphX, partial [Hyphomicrobiales bacterium]
SEDVSNYVDFVLTPENAIELVAEVGYVPLPEEAFELAQQKVEAGRTGSFFGGESKIGVEIEDLLQAE